MAWKIKDILVNGLLVTLLALGINYVVKYIAGMFSWLNTILNFGAPTVGLTVATVLVLGIAIEINKQIREKSGIGFLK